MIELDVKITVTVVSAGFKLAAVIGLVIALTLHRLEQMKAESACAR